MEITNVKVLFAEDDAVARRLLESTLKKWGFEVTSTSDGKQAWAVMDSDTPPEIAILDWVMPEMEGPEVCRLSREKGLNTYLILLTSKDSKADIVAGLEAGADDYVPKPFHPQELKARLSVGARIVALQRALSERIGLLEVANQKLEQLSLEDKLTGIPNRRFLDDVMEREWRRALRSSTPLSIIMIDIDSFKKFNDAYGHQEGDDCLRLVAQALRSCLKRAGDFIGRYGGEEFTVVLPNVDREGAMTVADHLRASVQNLGIKHEDCRSNIGVATISLGVAHGLPSPDSTKEAFISRADAALYLAKQRSGNQAVFAEDEAK